MKSVMNPEWQGKTIALATDVRKGLYDHYKVDRVDEYGNIVCVSIKNSRIITRLVPEYVQKLFNGEERFSHVVGLSKPVAPETRTVQPTSTVKKAEKPHPVLKVEGKSKRELAMEIYARMSGSSRHEVIQAFVNELGMTPAGASTYYQNCKTLWK